MDGARFRPLLFVAMFPSVQKTRADDLGRVYDVQVGGRDEIKNVRERTDALFAVIDADHGESVYPFLNAGNGTVQAVLFKLLN